MNRPGLRKIPWFFLASKPLKFYPLEPDYGWLPGGGAV
jgi:hypothetical protein